jgi:hypothetical protein
MRKDDGAPGGYTRQAGFAILALVAASCWPFMNFIAGNVLAFFNLRWALCYAAVAAVLSVAVTFLLSVVTRKPFVRLAVPVIVFVVLFFSYGTLRQGYLAQFSPRLAPLLWAGGAALACALAWIVSRYRNVPGGIFAAALVLFALPAETYLTFHDIDAANASVDRAGMLHGVAFRRKPNVYFMILDAYARADTLKQALGFDNEGFVGELRKLGFFVPQNSVSNYPATNASVASMLSLDYLPKAQDISTRVVPFSRELLGDNPVVEKFKSEGYRYALVPGGIWTKISCAGWEDVCFEKTRPLEMERALMSLTPLQVLPAGKYNYLSRWLAPTPAEYLEPRDLFGLFGDRIRALQSPFFMMVHFAGIHDRIYNEDCSGGTIGHPALFDPYSVGRYVASVRCTNRQMVELVTTILAADPDAIMILTGDHGPYVRPPHVPYEKGQPIKPFSWGADTPEDYRNTFGTTTAIKLPAQCGSLLSDHHYAVNNFRIVFGCLGDRKIDLLEDRAYYFYYDEHRVATVRRELLN